MWLLLVCQGRLFIDDNYLKVSKNKLLAKYPMLKDKKIILYAPTFRGNIYKVFNASI